MSKFTPDKPDSAAPGAVSYTNVDALIRPNVDIPNAQAPPKKQEEPAPSTDTGKAPKQRLVSLDAFRGFTILLMLLVNNMALDTSTPQQLMHAPWNKGIHLADFVFPWFLFCVGVAIPFSNASARKKGVPSWRIDLRILQRGIILVLLGCLLASSFERRPIFALGVLQIIGLAYVVAAFLYELPLSRRLIIAGLLLTAYSVAIKFLPVPGLPVGVFTESGNFIGHINKTYLSRLQLGGLPSVIPTAALALIGTAIGDVFMRKDRSHRWKLAWLFGGGLLLIAGGMAWNLHLPYNKPVWTPSYILLTAGTGCWTLGVFYLLTDAWGKRAWAYPLIVFGSNAIVAYVAPIMVKAWVFQSYTLPVQGGERLSLGLWIPHWYKVHLGAIPGGWLYTASWILLWWIVLWILHRFRIYVRV